MLCTQAFNSANVRSPHAMNHRVIGLRGFALSYSIPIQNYNIRVCMVKATKRTLRWRRFGVRVAANRGGFVGLDKAILAANTIGSISACFVLLSGRNGASRRPPRSGVINCSKERFVSRSPDRGDSWLEYGFGRRQNARFLPAAGLLDARTAPGQEYHRSRVSIPCPIHLSFLSHRSSARSLVSAIVW